MRVGREPVVRSRHPVSRTIDGCVSSNVRRTAGLRFHDPRDFLVGGNVVDGWQDYNAYA